MEISTFDRSGKVDSKYIWLGLFFGGLMKLFHATKYFILYIYEKNPKIDWNIYLCDSILEFKQSWNFFHQLYNYSKKILYETQQNIYI